MNTLVPGAAFDMPGVDIADGAHALKAIRKPDCAAAIWHRRPNSKRQRWIDELHPDQLPQGRLILRRETVSDAVLQLCEIAGMPHTSERDGLINDIVALSAFFSDLMTCAYLRLRLDKVTDNACRKFHKDTISARLVCTYRGAGTQYGLAIDGEKPRHIATVPTGSPIVLRGKLWPETPQLGLLHRSPPIEGTGETRLVLVLDPIFDPEAEV